MNSDILKIKKILLVSLSVLILVGIACFFIFERQQFYSILASGLLTFIFFTVTLLFYYSAAKSRTSNIAKYVFLVFFIKIILSALSFYIVFKFGYINELTYSFSFLIFFTIFFNLEIFLIYKKYLFYKK